MNETPRKHRAQNELPGERNTNRSTGKHGKKGGKALYYLILAALVAVLVFSSVKIISYLKDQREAENIQSGLNSEFTAPDPSTTTPDDGSGDEDGEGDKKDPEPMVPDPESIVVDFAAMQAKYPDVVGYLYCANTVIKYPVVQTAEEGGEYYLYRDIDGKDNKNGTIFMDWRCNSDFSTQNNLIYGHNMKTGLMFASLMNYKYQSYYDAHPYLYLYTPSQTYKINLFAGFVTEHDSDVYSLSLSSSYLQECINNSTFRAGTGVPTGNIVTLSTCDYDFDNARYVVLGEMVAVDNPAE